MRGCARRPRAWAEDGTNRTLSNLICFGCGRHIGEKGRAWVTINVVVDGSVLLNLFMISPISLRLTTHLYLSPGKPVVPNAAWWSLSPKWIGWSLQCTHGLINGLWLIHTQYLSLVVCVCASLSLFFPSCRWGLLYHDKCFFFLAFFLLTNYENGFYFFIFFFAETKTFV